MEAKREILAISLNDNDMFMYEVLPNVWVALISWPLEGIEKTHMKEVVNQSTLHNAASSEKSLSFKANIKPSLSLGPHSLVKKNKALKLHASTMPSTKCIIEEVKMGVGIHQYNK